VITNHLTSILTASVTQKTVQVDKTALLLLTQESLEKSASITKIEEAATQLYKALQAGRDTGKMPIYLHDYNYQLDFTTRYGRHNGKAQRVQNLQYPVL